MPNKMPITGLSSANQSEKSHPAMLWDLFSCYSSQAFEDRHLRNLKFFCVCAFRRDHWFE
jgi:hypothetical protein